MNVTRDVISDLWPLVQAGESSDDSRKLVEEFLRSDSEFADSIVSSDQLSLPKCDLSTLAASQEMQVLQRTRKLIGLRDVLLGASIFLTLSPMTVYDTSWGSGWVLRDHPWLAAILGGGALVSWWSYYSLRRKLSSSGL